MKLLLFNDFRLGALVNGRVVDLSDLVGDLAGRGPQGLMTGLIASDGRYADAIADAAMRREGIPLERVRIRPPLPRPGTIVGMAVNYREGGTRSALINGFLKPGSSVIGDGDEMVLPDAPASVFEGEAELGVVIGRPALNVAASKAMDHVFGYVNFIDGNARGLPPDKNTFFQRKARHTFAPLGPFLVTADEVQDPQDLLVRQWANGDLKQSYRTSDMAHPIPECIAWVSSVLALEPGDLIATGTNHQGLFAYQDGDQVEVEIEHLGRLHVRVRDDLKRTWDRETRLEREKQGLSAVPPQLTGKYAQTSGGLRKERTE